MTMDEARARVAKGAALLDEKKPGWVDRINVDTLTLADPCGCILGQLCGHFERGMMAIYSPNVGAVAFGFDVSRSEDDIDEAYAVAQAAWLEAIESRRPPVVQWTHNGERRI